MNLIDMFFRFLSQLTFVEILVEYQWWYLVRFVVIAFVFKIVLIIEDVFVGA